MTTDRTPADPRRVAVWVLLALVAFGALFVATVDGGGATTAADRAREIAASVRCPTCRGQSVLESNASTARAIRREITQRIDDGQSDDEIRAYLVSVHGQSVLLTPPRSGIAGLVWVLPVVAIGAGLAAVAAALHRWRTVEITVDPDDEDLVARTRRAAP